MRSDASELLMKPTHIVSLLRKIGEEKVLLFLSCFTDFLETRGEPIKVETSTDADFIRFFFFNYWSRPLDWIHNPVGFYFMYLYQLLFIQ